MFKTIKRWIGRIKCWMLQVPDAQTLTGCFKNEYPTMPNPVKRLSVSGTVQGSIDLTELDQFITQQHQLALEATKVVEAVNKIEGLQHYRREPVSERPKFKCKGPTLPQAVGVNVEPGKSHLGNLECEDRFDGPFSRSVNTATESGPSPERPSFKGESSQDENNQKPVFVGEGGFGRITQEEIDDVVKNDPIEMGKAEKQPERIKIRSAYDMGFKAQEKGLIEQTREALNVYVEEIMKFDDAAFESLQRVMSNYGTEPVIESGTNTVADLTTKEMAEQWRQNNDVITYKRTANLDRPSFKIGGDVKPPTAEEDAKNGAKRLRLSKQTEECVVQAASKAKPKRQRTTKVGQKRTSKK